MEDELWIKIGARILKSFPAECDLKWNIDIGVCRIVSYSQLEQINNIDSMPDSSFIRRMFLRMTAESRYRFVFRHGTGSAARFWISIFLVF